MKRVLKVVGLVLLVLVVAGAAVVAGILHSWDMDKAGSSLGQMALSSDGRRCACEFGTALSGGDPTCRLVLVENGRAAVVDGPAPGQSAGFFSAMLPSWRPDGRVLAWVRMDASGMWLMTRSVEGAVRSVSLGGVPAVGGSSTTGMPQLLGWCPDGVNVLVRRNTPEGVLHAFSQSDSSLWKVNAADGSATFVAGLHGKRDVMHAGGEAWLGRTLFIMYGKELFRIPEGSDELLPVGDLGRVLQVSGDGRERLLVLTRRDSRYSVMELRRDALSSPKVLITTSKVHSPEYGPGGVYLVRKGRKGDELCLLRGGRLVSLLSGPSELRYEVSRNGRVWVRLDERRVEEVVVKDGRVAARRPVELKGL